MVVAKYAFTNLSRERRIQRQEHWHVDDRCDGFHKAGASNLLATINLIQLRGPFTKLRRKRGIQQRNWRRVGQKLSPLKNLRPERRLQPPPLELL